MLCVVWMHGTNMHQYAWTHKEARDKVSLNQKLAFLTGMAGQWALWSAHFHSPMLGSHRHVQLCPPSYVGGDSKLGSLCLQASVHTHWTISPATVYLVSSARSTIATNSPEDKLYLFCLFAVCRWDLPVWSWQAWNSLCNQVGLELIEIHPSLMGLKVCAHVWQQSTLY